MELRHLRTFIAAAELENFGRASRRLNLAQPALSRQVRELEDELGSPLFERLPRGVRLTAAGRAFAADARDLLASLERSVARARRVASGIEGVLKIGFVDTAVYHPFLPRWFDRFRRARPGVKLELHQLSSLAQAAELGEGRLDAGFVYHLPERVPCLASRALLGERVVLAAPFSHRLANRRKVRLADLRDEAFVWIPRVLSPAYHDLVFEACGRAGFCPNVVQEGGTDSAILSLVAAGAGLTFCLESARHRLPPGVALMPVGDLRVRFTLSLVWREDSRNPALAEFLAAAPAGV